MQEIIPGTPQAVGEQLFQAQFALLTLETSALSDKEPFISSTKLMNFSKV